MNLSDKAARILARQGFMSVNGVQMPASATNGGLTKSVRLPVRRERSQNEHTCQVLDYKCYAYWLIHCAHERLWTQPCQQCARVGINGAERATRAREALRVLLLESTV